MTQTRRFLGGRHPLCGIGVTSRIERICRPAVASAWIADSRPEPGPCTRTCTRRTPRFIASRAACSAATVAANGVDFFEPWKPALPEDPQVRAFPCMSVIVMSVLLNVAVMWAMPSASTTFLARFAPAALACAIYFFRRGFFARDRAPRPLLGARVGVRALAAHRQSLAMPRAAVRPDVHQPLDVHRDLGPQRALDLVVPLDHLAQPRDLRVAQVTNARIRIDPGLRENLLRVPRAEAVDVRESVQNLLVARQVDARNACHVVLSLPLLVLGTALADDADDTPPLDHLTMLADRFDAGPNLQTAHSGGKNF